MMSSQYIISVIVPIYKVEKYLRKCIDSIITQTYKNLEIFLVDDGSPDNCGAICDEYARKDERIKVIHKENGGLSSARNAALDVATGDFIMFVDSDDWVEPEFCEKALYTAIRNNVQIVAFGYNNVYTRDGKIQKRATDKPRIVPSTEAIRHLILKDEVIFNFAWNKIYKRTLFDEIRYPVGMTYEDNAVTYLVIHYADNIFVSNDILYNYVRRKESISGVWNKPQSIVDRFIIWTNRLNFIKVICPENEKIQLLQIANEVVDGLWYLTRKKNYSHVVGKMEQFMTDNRQAILKETNSLKFKVYYYARPLYPIMKIAGIILTKIKKVIKWI